MSRAENIARARASQRKLRGVDVIYDDGNGLIPVRAIVGRTLRNTVDNNGSMTKIEIRDYLIAVSDLRRGNVLVEPRKGHRIIESLQGSDKVYELLPLGSDEPEWRYSDDMQVEYRIHTKLVKS